MSATNPVIRSKHLIDPSIKVAEPAFSEDRLLNWVGRILVFGSTALVGLVAFKVYGLLLFILPTIWVLLQIFGVFEYKQELCVSYPARE